MIARRADPLLAHDMEQLPETFDTPDSAIWRMYAGSDADWADELDRPSGFRKRDTRQESSGVTSALGYLPRAGKSIQRDIRERLIDDAELDACDVLVSVNGGEVILDGLVLDRHAWQRAESIARSVKGVATVHNRLEIQRSMAAELVAHLLRDDD